jgi:iron complex outermembrane receptor protein
VLRRLPQSTGPTFDEKFQNSFAPGTAGVSLRGLSPGRTLVLLNGRRLVPYGFGQNINEVFVDLNSLPLAALEQVEILKDSASALYGSDAIGGEVNLKLRKGYDGTEFTVRYGNPTEADMGSEQRQIITGSHIPAKVKRYGRTADTVSAVYILDRKDCERLGAANVGEALRRIPFAH